MNKTCARCEEEFTPRRLNQKYCRKDCKRVSRPAQELKRADWTAKPQNFIGVDGEGFKRPAFIPFASITDQEEIDEINELIKTGDIEVEHEEDPYTGNMQAGFWEEDAYHAYEMLTVGDETIGKRGHELTADEILEFLYAHFEAHADEKTVYVGFFLGYDFTMWLRHLYWKHAHKLLTKEGIESRTRRTFDEDGKLVRVWKFPVTLWNPEGGADFEVEMLGNKRFSIRRFYPYELRKVIKTEITDDGSVREIREPHPYKWMNICDAGPFFATSFLNAINPAKSIDPVVTADEFTILERGKANRDKADFDSNTVEYNVLENEVLKRLMMQLAGGLRSIGIELRNGQWYGPGAAAQKTMDLWGVMTRKELSELIPEEYEEAARDTYYGGWFETMMLGIYLDTAHEYDINSAYPKIIETLPCMCSMRYDKGVGKPPIDNEPDTYIVVDVRTFAHRNPDKRPSFGGLSHRNADGSIMRPLETRGLHFLHELEAARRAGCFERARIYRWWRFRKGCTHAPFAKIRQMYLERLRVGKNTPRGIAYKLVYNSMYGKLAQSVGMPKYANPLYASLITAGCRTMILDAVSHLPNKTHDVLMIATDGLYTKVAMPDGSIEIDPEKLGAWEHKELEGFTVVMPGVHYTHKTRQDIEHAREQLGLNEKPDYSSIKMKARGVSAKDIGGSVAAFDEAFFDMLQNPKNWVNDNAEIKPELFPKVRVTVDFSLTSPKLALARGKWSTCGTVEPAIREISTVPFTKRRSVGYDFTPEGHLYLRSKPYISSGDDIHTKFYRSMFGSESTTPSIFLEDFDHVLTQYGEVGGHVAATFGLHLA